MGKEKKRVLFSCFGTSDPIRGEHDGPLLHILRHYKPSGVFIVVSPEIEKLSEQDSRLLKTQQYIRDKWDDYAPEVTVLRRPEIEDPSDLDLVDESIQQSFRECLQKYPDAEILLNISSGTPQMKTIMSYLATDPRYKTKAIQVKNFERTSGTSERTNMPKYDIDCQTEFNEDDFPDAENRCDEPKMFAIHRRNTAEQIRALLEKREFAALAQMKNMVNGKLHPLIDHLSERSQLHWKEATSLSRIASPGFDLYPINKDIPFPSVARKTAYQEISEYALLMRNLQRSGKLSEFVLRLEPLVRNLQNAILEDLLWKQYGIHFEDILDGRKYLPERIKALAEPLYNQLTMLMGEEPQEKDISTWYNDKLLACLSDVPEKPKKLFELYENLRDKRNKLAHQLNVTTENEIRTMCGAGSKEIEQCIEQAIQECFPQCNPAIFNVYDKCISYIEDNL